MSLETSFYQLSADRVLNAIEQSMLRTDGSRRATGSVLALNSLENRVYQIPFEDGFEVVAKFYRPGRWTRRQIEDEHDFLFKLQSHDVPVVAPLRLEGFQGKSVGETEGIFFAVFPRVKGRLRDELNASHLQTLGRYLGRIHRIGQAHHKTTRYSLNPKTFGWDPLNYLESRNFFETESVKEQYLSVAKNLIQQIEPLVEGHRSILVHGDCHLGNVLWSDESPYFLDFDDLSYAPAVQDVWMIVRGRDIQAENDRKTLLTAYEQMNEFDESSLLLIEPLRALRIVHYSAWIAKRWEDPAFALAFPDFGTTKYWYEEISELYKIQEQIRNVNDS